MAFEQLLQAAVPEWAIDCGWPYTRSNMGAIASQVTTTDRLGEAYHAGTPAQSANVDAILKLPFIWAIPKWARNNGTVCMVTTGTLNQSGFNVGENIVIDGPLLAGQIPFSVSGPFRCYIDEWYVSWNTAAPVISVEDKPIIYFPTDGGSVINTDTSGILGAQYGIRGDGAGGFEFFSTIGGVLQEAVAIAWPEADLRSWVKVGAQHKVANGSRAATFDLLINDAEVLSRTWEAGTTLPDLTDAAAGTGQFMRRQFRQGVNANVMNIAMIRVRAGQFDVNGTEVS